MIYCFAGSSTAPFYERELAELFEELIEPVTYQSKSATRFPANVTLSPFIDLTSVHIDPCDVIIAHCGAGLTFWALATQGKLISIVNTQRPDPHQRDLGNWLSRNEYALVLNGRVPNGDEIRDISLKSLKKYQNDDFQFNLLKQHIRG
jgi:UDP-N-acetylglucosamine transferase subunit ALG13